jgi:hypothetical protein
MQHSLLTSIPPDEYPLAIAPPDWRPAPSPGAWRNASTPPPFFFPASFSGFLLSFSTLPFLPFQSSDADADTDGTEGLAEAPETDGTLTPTLLLFPSDNEQENGQLLPFFTFKSIEVDADGTEPQREALGTADACAFAIDGGIAAAGVTPEGPGGDSNHSDQKLPHHPRSLATF